MHECGRATASLRIFAGCHCATFQSQLTGLDRDGKTKMKGKPIQVVNPSLPQPPPFPPTLRRARFQPSSGPALQGKIHFPPTFMKKPSAHLQTKIPACQPQYKSKC